jgi:nitroreductase
VMDVIDAIKMRKSTRAFKSDPVPKETIRAILEIACRAPSAMNTQPWEFTVASGEVLEKIRKGNVEKLNAGQMPNPEHLVVGWTNDSIYRKRQVELAKQIFQIMGITREDKVKRAQWMERGFRYFDAPVAIIIYVDRSLSESGPLIDVGAVVQNICLAALHFGLGTCIEDQGVMYPEVVKKFAGIPESKRLLIAISMGYSEESAQANRVASTRESVDDLTTWVGFS